MITPLPDDMSPEDFVDAMWQSLGLVLQTVAQQTNGQRLLADLQARLSAARIVGIHPLAVHVLERASSVLELESKG